MSSRAARAGKHRSLFAHQQRPRGGATAGILTLVETVHVELSDERGNVGMLEVLATSSRVSNSIERLVRRLAYASTLENSCEGCMTKLSEVGVHEIKCCIDLSSSILSA